MNAVVLQATEVDAVGLQATEVDPAGIDAEWNTALAQHSFALWKSGKKYLDKQYFKKFIYLLIKVECKFFLKQTSYSAIYIIG